MPLAGDIVKEKNKMNLVSPRQAIVPEKSKIKQEKNSEYQELVESSKPTLYETLT